MDVGAYVLGVLDEAEMDRFEEHLAQCAMCSRQLDELGVIGPVLAELRQAGVPRPPQGPGLDRLLREVAAERRARRRRQQAVAVAAAVLIVAGPVAAVLATRPAAPPARSAGSVRTATDPATGVRATVSAAGQPWGTEVQVTVSGVQGPLTCRLVAVTRSGGEQTAATWQIPRPRSGAARSGPLTVWGAAAAPPSEIARFEVVTSAGRRLVFVPV